MLRQFGRLYIILLSKILPAATATYLLVSCAISNPTLGGFAIIYGISLYDGAYGEGIGNNLSYSDDDAVSVSDLFEEQGYQVITRINSDATKKNLEADVEWVAEMIGPGEPFVFYFSGHGISYTFNEIAEISKEPMHGDTPDEWIFLHGSVDYDALVDLQKGLSDDQLGSLLSPIDTSKKVIFIDACNSGGFIGTQCEIDAVSQAGDAGNPLGLIDALTTFFSYTKQIESDIPANQAVVISAAGEQELSYEAYEYSHGVFTHHFLSVVTEADRDRDGVITLTESYAYVRTMIESTWDYESFVPRISGGPVDFALFSTSPAPFR